MQFTDPVYLFVLLPVACVLFYWMTPRFGTSAGFAALLAISLLFYATWGKDYLLLLILSFTANFAVACIVITTPDESVLLRRMALWLGQLYNFGTLFWFKYRFVTEFFSAGGTRPSLFDIAIPAGISFYTFQQAIFLVDAYHRDASALAYLGELSGVWGKLRGYLRHSFFVSFFAHVLIGPIVYLSEFRSQTARADFGRAKRTDLEAGCALIIIGLFKKIVIADHLGRIADTVFRFHGQVLLHTQIPTVAAWTAAIAYCAQLYFDFSGYSDLAIGSARLFGIRFPINFFSPLKADGIVDFYRRWHITLTRVISRFVYTPLSIAGARGAISLHTSTLARKALMLWLPLIVNFEVIALWHGLRLTFILFGLIHGCWYVIETEARASRTLKRWRAGVRPVLRHVLGRGIFLFLIVLTFVLFRVDTVPDYLHLLGSMFSLQKGTADLKSVAELSAALFIIWFLPNSMQLLARYRAGIVTYPNKDYTPLPLRMRWRPDAFWTLAMSALLAACLYFISIQPPFLYLGF